jgi:hypothetical protein
MVEWKPRKISLSSMAAMEIIKKYFLLRYTPENKAMAATGVKLAGWGISLEKAANKINSTATIKFIILKSPYI